MQRARPNTKAESQPKVPGPGEQLLDLLSVFAIHFLWDRRWFFIAMMAGGGLLLLPQPEGLSREGMIVIAMSVAATIMFISEPIPLPAVALLIVLGEIFLLGKESGEVARSLWNDSVLFILGSLMLAVAVVKQKLDKRIAWLIVRMTGTPTWRVVLGISVVSGLLASFVGEHTVAAMMLPVGITLVSLASDDPAEVRRLAAVILLAIAYGASVAAIGTPSGGARNAIMINYWQEFFYDPGNPETRQYMMGYLRWMIYAYPLFLIQIPFVTLVLISTFRPEFRDMSRPIVRLRAMVESEGAMKRADWVAVGLFFLTLLGWIFLSDRVGMGTIAIVGATMFLVAGLVRWEDINSGVNWGVVLLYGAAISLGIEMKSTGAANWVAESFLGMLAPFGAREGLGLWAAVSVLTTGIANTMSAGASVAILGPIVLHTAEVAQESPIIMGFVTAISTAFGYLTVFAAPACVIVYASGYLKAIDFLRAGWKMAVVSIIILLLAATFYWPLLGA